MADQLLSLQHNTSEKEEERRLKAIAERDQKTAAVRHCCILLRDLQL